MTPFPLLLQSNLPMASQCQKPLLVDLAFFLLLLVDLALPWFPLLPMDLALVLLTHTEALERGLEFVSFTMRMGLCQDVNQESSLEMTMWVWRNYQILLRMKRYAN